MKISTHTHMQVGAFIHTIIYIYLQLCLHTWADISPRKHMPVPLWGVCLSVYMYALLLKGFIYPLVSPLRSMPVVHWGATFLKAKPSTNISMADSSGKHYRWNIKTQMALPCCCLQHREQVTVHIVPVCLHSTNVVSSDEAKALLK